MFYIHLHGGQEKEALIKEIKERFEKIYQSISSIEYRMREDDVLVYTQRVYFNSLLEGKAVEKINKLLSEPQPKPILFIKSFTLSLAETFAHLKTFLREDEREHFDVHSLVTLGGIAVVVPFIIKAYKFGLPVGERNALFQRLESVVLRHRLVGTRANITSRLNDVYQSFTSNTPSIQPIVERIDFMKTTDDWWWAYWGNAALARSVQGFIHHTTAKYLLWKYENHLKSQHQAGYKWERFDQIPNADLEHIAPRTPTKGDAVAAGYPAYDEEFQNQYIDSLGNYLLISASHNRSIGNIPFAEKRESYNFLAQQREIQQMTDAHHPCWTKELIQQRKEKIIQYVLTHL